MGNTDKIIIPFYKSHIKPEAPTALLGFTNNNMFEGDLYDVGLGNWDINTWEEPYCLPKKYKTIICTRCAYFAMTPECFLGFCHNSLEEGGMLYVDWGLGDHWRFDNFKVGWQKDGESEYGGKPEYRLYSAIWDESFLDHPQCKIFIEAIKEHGYDDLKKAICDEVFAVCTLDYIRESFEVDYDILTTTKPYLQMYILLKLRKR